MEDRNTIQDSNRGDRQNTSNRELELERKLMRESTRLDDADTYNMNYEQSIKISMRQNEMYKKWKLLKGIREAREKLYEGNEKNNESHNNKAK